jgi:hypothetical protein
LAPTIPRAPAPGGPPTPWHATQRAAWEALRQAEGPRS